MSVGMLALLSVAAFLLAAFFAGSETAIIAANRVRMRHLATKGDKRARLVLKYINNPEYFLSVVLVGTNLGVIGCTATFTAIMIEFFGTSGPTVATVILVPTLLIFEEIIPKGVFLYYADRASILAIYLLQVSAYILFPVIHSLSRVSVFFTKLFGIGRIDRKVTMSMEELLFHVPQAAFLFQHREADLLLWGGRLGNPGGRIRGGDLLPVKQHPTVRLQAKTVTVWPALGFPRPRHHG